MATMEGQRAVVTGGTRGIGAAISRGLLGAGARVLATYERNSAAAEALVRDCREHGERLSIHRFDVADPAAVGAFFAELEDPIQILINNSGVRKDGLVGMMSAESWERVLAVNLSGAFHMCKQAVRSMVSGRYGRIVNISSYSAAAGLAGQANYAASKAGLEAMTRSLAREVARLGITVNCISAGLIDTELIQDLPAPRLAELLAAVPLGRPGTPAEVAEAVRFLASREASYITGATLPVTGGI